MKHRQYKVSLIHVYFKLEIFSICIHFCLDYFYSKSVVPLFKIDNMYVFCLMF